ncbi:hypothetical protein CYMTET_34907 [Cymbomonas tetramitiformis]|uniref:SET domain-containing protein n=1 Tax=Cymbomonas tetramitiformis TaxID=36881 RepID=A0AAE0FAQ4_9CHLO|nr:hypothetical protein CYMTET_34907 [Cymbomonas tetramitiformis]
MEFPVRHVEIPGRGRALVAARDIRPGETILNEPPTLIYVTDDSKGSVCAQCLRVLSGDRISESACCSCDGQASFCSPQCAETAAVCGGAHSPNVCRSFCGRPPAFCGRPPSFSKLRPTFFLSLPQRITRPGLKLRRAMKAVAKHLQALPLEERDLLRFLIQVYVLKIEQNLDSPYAGDISRRLTALYELAPAVVPAESSGARQASKLHPLVCAALGVDPGSEQETAALLCKDEMNSYGIMNPRSPDGEPSIRGNGVFCQAARINHSCLPNVARFDFVDVAGSDNTHMLMRAMDAIPEGSEILQSYFPLNTPLPERRQRTVEIYGFACDCARCAFEAQQGDAAPSDKMDADGDEEEEEEEEESEWETDDDEDLVGEGTDAIHAKEGDDDFESQLSIYILKNLCPHAHCNGGHVCFIPYILKESA